jgi:hypothetical protein
MLKFRQGVLPLYQKVIRQELQGWVGELITTVLCAVKRFFWPLV